MEHVAFHVIILERKQLDYLAKIQEHASESHVIICTDQEDIDPAQNMGNKNVSWTTSPTPEIIRVLLK